MKDNYATPEAEILYLKDEDVITSSGVEYDPNNPGGSGGETSWN